LRPRSRPSICALDSMIRAGPRDTGQTAGRRRKPSAQFIKFCSTELAEHGRLIAGGFVEIERDYRTDADLCTVGAPALGP